MGHNTVRYDNCDKDNVSSLPCILFRYFGNILLHKDIIIIKDHREYHELL